MVIGAAGNPLVTADRLQDGIVAKFAAPGMVAARPDATGLRRQLDLLSHWAWLPALFCGLLAWVIDSAPMRGLLAALALCTVAAGYGLAHRLGHGLREACTRLDATGAPTMSVATAARDLARVQRVVAALPGTYASIAVAAQLAATSFLVSPAIVAGAGHAGMPAVMPQTPAGASAPIILVEGGPRSIRPLRSQPQRLPAERASGAVHDPPGLSVTQAQRPFFDTAPWSVNPDDDVATGTRAQAAAPDCLANPGGGQRVLPGEECGPGPRVLGVPLAGGPMPFEGGPAEVALPGQ